MDWLILILFLVLPAAAFVLVRARRFGWAWTTPLVAVGLGRPERHLYRSGSGLRAEAEASGASPSCCCSWSLPSCRSSAASPAMSRTGSRPRCGRSGNHEELGRLSGPRAARNAGYAGHRIGATEVAVRFAVTYTRCRPMPVLLRHIGATHRGRDVMPLSLVLACVWGPRGRPRRHGAAALPLASRLDPDRHRHPASGLCHVADRAGLGPDLPCRPGPPRPALAAPCVRRRR